MNSSKSRLVQVVSGGQTGADRAGLDAALALSINIGGFCPKGRRAEDGTIPAQYTLIETPSKDYYARTKKNVRYADYTILIWGPTSEPDGGTRLTRDYCEEFGKPHYQISLSSPISYADMVRIINNRVGERDFILNVAGPRESKSPGLQEQGKLWLIGLFELLRG